MTSEKEEIWKPEEYVAYHKLVFRVMFDFLNAHFPPQDDPEWWMKIAEDTEKASDRVKGGILVNGMLLAINDYLDNEYKKRRNANE